MPMIDLHYWTTPNGHKITIFLEETGLAYKIFPINIGKGEQFAKDFLKISPNNRIPAMVDHEPLGGGARRQRSRLRQSSSCYGRGKSDAYRARRPAALPSTRRR